MSEHVYEFGDPVEYQTDGQWYRGTYIGDDGTGHNQHLILSVYPSGRPGIGYRGTGEVRPLPKPPKPETPEPWVSLDKDEAQRLIADLSAALSLIEWLERREPGSYRKPVLSAISKMINQVAIALGALGADR